MCLIDNSRLVLISACLLGKNCRYDGGNKKSLDLIEKLQGIETIPVCPELLGGLTSPRPPVEIQSGDGKDVLNGWAKVRDRDGSDLTEAFLHGAYETYGIAVKHKVTEAVFKANSPSCGKGKIYDGSFCGRLIDGNGVTTALLLNEGINVWTEEEWLERMGNHV